MFVNITICVGEGDAPLPMLMPAEGLCVWAAGPGDGEAYGWDAFWGVEPLFRKPV